MSLRSPIKRVKGLGSAKSGVHHWWMQRLTAVAMVPLVLWFSFSVASLAGADYASVHAWVSQPLTTGLLVLLLGALIFHGQLGLQVVIEDYVHARSVQLAAVVAVKLLAILLAVVGILAVLRVALGG